MGVLVRYQGLAFAVLSTSAGWCPESAYQVIVSDIARNWDGRCAARPSWRGCEPVRRLPVPSLFVDDLGRPPVGVALDQLRGAGLQVRGDERQLVAGRLGGVLASATLGGRRRHPSSTAMLIIDEEETRRAVRKVSPAMSATGGERERIPLAGDQRFAAIVELVPDSAS